MSRDDHILPAQHTNISPNGQPTQRRTPSANQTRPFYLHGFQSHHRLNVGFHMSLRPIHSDITKSSGKIHVFLKFHCYGLLPRIWSQVRSRRYMTNIP